MKDYKEVQKKIMAVLDECDGYDSLTFQVMNIVIPEIERAEKEKEVQVLNDKYADFVEADKEQKRIRQLEGARELVGRIDKNCELYEKPVDNVECELMIRHDDIKKQLAELEEEMK